MEIKKLRKKIDKTDKKISKLLSKRFSAVNKIGEIKRSVNAEIYDGNREEEVLNAVRNSAGEYGNSAVKVYMEILAVSKEIQAEK